MASNEPLMTSSAAVSDSLALSVTGSINDEDEPLWKSFPGRNRFYCNGRLMLGCDVDQFLLSNFMIVLPVALFAGRPYLLDAPGVVLSQAAWELKAGGMLLGGIALGLLWTVALRDPGVIPRRAWSAKWDPDADLAYQPLLPEGWRRRRGCPRG